MTDPTSGHNDVEIEARLRSLRSSVISRPVPGLEDARKRAQKHKRYPVQLAIFVFLVAFGVTALVVYAVPGRSDNATTEASPSQTTTQIIRFVQIHIRGLAISPVTELQWVSTNAEDAARLSNMTQNTHDSQPVYLIEISGAFSSSSCINGGAECSPVPVPQSVPKRSCETVSPRTTGHQAGLCPYLTGPLGATTCMPYKVATFIVDRDTLQLKEASLQQGFDDLSALGEVRVDRLTSGPLYP
ncbi:MAG: hypothetical protein WAM97_11625, partial [Acidimicrobiales bacterium]